MKIQLLFRPPKNRTEDYWLKLWSAYKSRELESWVVELYVYRLFPYLVAGFLISYFTLALMLFVWISRKPHKEVGYWDVVVMPFDWKEFQRKRGRMVIEAGQQDIRDGKFREGVMKIRMGLGKYPEDRDSRIFLAQIYYITGLINPAHELMMDGIELGVNDVDFLNSFFSLCFQAEAFQSVLEASELVLADPEFSKNPDNVYFINRQQVSSLIELGRLEEALTIAQKVNNDPKGTRRMVDAEYLALERLGKPIEALTLLERWKFRINAQNLQLHSLFIDAYTALNDDKNLSRSIRELIAMDPSNPDLRLMAMKKWHQAGKQEELSGAFTSYLLLFGWNPDNLTKLNNYVTSIRQIELIEQVLNFIRKQGMNEDVVLFNLFYAYLMDGRWDEAGGVLDLLKGVIDSFSEIDQKLIGIGETIVLLKTEKRDNLRLLLLQELRRIRASIVFYVTVGDILGQSELHNIAVDTLEQGLAIFPDSPRIENAYAEATRNAIQHAKDNAQVEVEEVLELSPDQYLTQLDALMDEGRYEEAEDLLTHINRVGAPWLAGRKDDFEYRKLHLYFETSDSLIQSQTTSLFLNTNPHRGPDLVELAVNYLNAGKPEKSRILAEEIVRIDPRNREARALLNELGESTSDQPTIELGRKQDDSTTLGSKTKVFADLIVHLENANWKATESLIQRILKSNPSWLPKNRQEFDLLHIRYYVESDNFPSASSLIRIYMGSDPKSARELLDLAKVYQGKQRDAEFSFLVDQVNQKFPNMKL